MVTNVTMARKTWQQLIFETLVYDPKTGEFTRRCTGKPAFLRKKDGYSFVSVWGKFYQAHRIAWTYVYGDEPSMIDHKNRDKTDNRIGNLRIATASQNAANSKRSSRNTSGFKGASLDRKSGRYVAQIKVNGRRCYLGRHDTPEQAHEAYLEAATKAFGEYARAG